MKKFRFKARDRQGKLVSGEVESTSQQLAARLVRKRGLIVYALSPSRGGIGSVFTFFKSRVTAGDVTIFTRQLATMINAGLPIVEALSILRMQSKSSFQQIVNQILADVEGGESFSSALKKHPKIFSPTYIALVKSGETGGVLEQVLNRLADNLEKEQEFKGKVKGALIYPAIIVIGMAAVSIIMVVFVIPRLVSLYSQFDAKLPLTTRALMALSSFFIHLWPLILLSMFLLFWGFTLYKRTKRGRRRIAEIMFRLPIIGDLRRQIILTELTRTLSLMIGAGVPILEGITITSEVIGNVIISEALVDAGKQIEKGFPVAYSFAKHPEAFPYILSQMMAVGEETGKMDEVLAKVSHVFEIDSEQKVKALTSAIEPVVMIILGIGVTFLVISVIMPIYNLTTVL
jgi:type IV pilus assembly protein PilC